MMDLKKILAVMIVALMGIVPVAAADAKFLISDVDYDDPVTPGSVMSVVVTLENMDLSKDVEDITVKAWLEDDDGLIGTKYKTHIVQIQQDSEKDITFDIAIPKDLEDGEYKFIVTADGEWEKGNTKVTYKWEGFVEVEQEDDAIAVTEMRLSAGTVTAGDAVDVAVTILNNGKDDQENVKVKVFIGDSETSITIPLLQEGEEQNVYMTLQLPKTLNEGIQTIKAQAYNGIVSASASKDIVVEAVKVQPQKQVTQTVTFPVQTIPAGKSSVFSLQVTNNDADSKTYSFTIGGLQDWASNTRADPGSITLGAGESATVQVHLIPTESGEHAFALFVKESGTTIATQIVKVNVTGETSTSGSSAGLLIVAAIVLLAIFAYFKGEGNGSGKKRETVYY